MENDFQRIEDAVEDACLALEHQIDLVLDFCLDPYGDARPLDKEEVKDLVKMLKEIIP